MLSENVLGIEDRQELVEITSFNACQVDRVVLCRTFDRLVGRRWEGEHGLKHGRMRSELIAMNIVQGILDLRTVPVKPSAQRDSHYK